MDQHNNEEQTNGEPVAVEVKPKKKRRRPTTRIVPRHRLVFEKVMKQGKSYRQAMIESGFSENSSHNPGLVTSSLSWKKLLEEALPESLLVERHRELLNKRDTETRVVGEGKDKRIEIVDMGVNTSAVSKGLEMAYKLHGKMKGEGEPAERGPSKMTVYNLFYKPEVRESISAFEDQLKKQIAYDEGEVIDIVEQNTTQEGGDAEGGSVDGGGPDAGEPEENGGSAGG